MRARSFATRARAEGCESVGRRSLRRVKSIKGPIDVAALPSALIGGWRPDWRKVAL